MSKRTHPTPNTEYETPKRAIHFRSILLTFLLCFNLFASNGATTERKPLPSPEEIAKLPPDGGPEYNRLVFSQSPYLLQHAANPVDWYPWGEEAFEAAREQNKPIFLSIGYSTCHWCHVMEHESFEDDMVAALLNEHFIPVKVDREERPDIDAIYMDITQAMTGSGGWPMTVVMTPERKPFFAGTYFPKDGNSQRLGMMQLLPAINEAWLTKQEELLKYADSNVDFLRRSSLALSANIQPNSAMRSACNRLEATYDERHGGFGVRGNKFPTPHQYMFLLRQWRRTGEEKALAMVEHSLTQMRLGGIFDHIGFGFHRYSTDPQWLLPHFEKMLYDQAMLTMAYVELYQATQKEEYARTAREILTYVLRDMTSPEGGFYSAEDADSEGEEGLFYLWEPDEILEVLGTEDGPRFIKTFNIESGGNFRDQATGEKTGLSIPHIDTPLTDSDRADFEQMRSKLFAEREKRIHPLKDDKILTDWNGLMIAAFAKAGTALEEKKYVDAAVHAAEFIEARLRSSDGTLLHRYRLGDAGLTAHLNDYAFLVWGLLELYEATFDIKFLKRAIELNEKMIELFWDTRQGGFFMTDGTDDELLIRPREGFDGAIPSGNSVAVMNLLRIEKITANKDFGEKALATIESLGETLNTIPTSLTQLLCAVDFLQGPSYEIVIAGDPKAADTQKLLGALHREFIPNRVVILRPDIGDDEIPPISEIAKFTKFQRAFDGEATAYVCQNYACNAPTTDPAEMLAALTQKQEPINLLAD